MNYDGEVSIRYEKSTMEDADKFFSAVADGDYETMVKMRTINEINSNFKQDVLDKGFLTEQRKMALGFREYIHAKGLWDEYLNYIKKAI